MGESAKIEAYGRSWLTGFFTYMKSIIMLLRVAHWAKNLFLFVPLFFAGELFNLNKLWTTAIGFIAFCLAASSIYILNDYKDLEKDRLHPVKRHRSLASGEVSVPVAFLLMSVCLIAGLLTGWFCGVKFFTVLLGYVVLNVFYSFGLKNISIVDILIIATGFVLRIKGGGILSQVSISQWLMIMVFLLSLFLALAKRRDDIMVKLETHLNTREVTSGYNLEFLNTSIAVVSAIMIMAYLMYTLSPDTIKHMGTYRLYYTAVFVFAGFMRYLQLIYIKKETRSPTRILYKDRFIQICMVLWVLSFYFIMYIKNINFHSA